MYRFFATCMETGEKRRDMIVLIKNSESTLKNTPTMIHSKISLVDLTQNGPIILFLIKPGESCVFVCLFVITTWDIGGYMNNQLTFIYQSIDLDENSKIELFSSYFGRNMGQFTAKNVYDRKLQVKPIFSFPSY